MAKPEWHIVTYNVTDADAYRADHQWRQSVGIPNGRVSYYQNGGGQIELHISDPEHILMLRLRHSAIRIASGGVSLSNGMNEGMF